MIFFHPEDGPNAADLAAIELRRGNDPDVVELLSVIRRLSRGFDPETRDLKERLRSTQEEVEGSDREIEELQEENRKLDEKVEDLRKEVRARNAEIAGLVAKNAELGKLIAYLEGRHAQSILATVTAANEAGR